MEVEPASETCLFNGRETVEIFKICNVKDNNPTELNSSWEAVSCSPTREFTNILQNQKIHYRVYNSPPLVPVLSQVSVVRNSPSCFHKIRFTIPIFIKVVLMISFLLATPNPLRLPLRSDVWYMPWLCHLPWSVYSNYSYIGDEMFATRHHILYRVFKKTLELWGHVQCFELS
jgi:hypothetical protein